MSKPQGHYKNIRIYFAYLWTEFKRKGTYMNALVVGAVINIFTLGNFFGSAVPFVVPILVQAFSRASLCYVNRFKERLMELPLERETPVFIMDHTGEIVLAGGHTRETFEEHNAVNIRDFIGPSGLEQILSMLENEKLDAVEVYSPKTKKWYEAKAKFKDVGDGSNILAWFDDITERKILDSRIYSMLSFSDNLLSNLDTFIRRKDTLERLARLILDSGYEGVVIGKNDIDGDLHGYAFKEENKQLKKSQEITIRESQRTSIFLSRQYSRVYFGDTKDFDTRAEFERTYPFDAAVKEFLGFPIENFVNYHEGGFSIEAINKKGKLSRYDSMLVETLVNHTRSMVLLIDLAEKNDEQFVQKVMGLCAAAEYSDEITGKHIYRINEYARVAAEALNCSEEFIHTIGQVAALHDIGKVAIPEFIKLERIYTSDESAKMQMHTIYGAKIIHTMLAHSGEDDKRLSMAYNIALNHHQWWNGMGYPGLKQNNTRVEPVSEDYRYYLSLEPLEENEIPLEALITSLADTYDALRSNRPYKRGFSHDETCERLALDRKAGAGGAQRFGPQVWGVFQKHHAHFDRIFRQMQE